jgi:hypothetical protein
MIPQKHGRFHRPHNSYVLTDSHTCSQTELNSNRSAYSTPVMGHGRLAKAAQCNAAPASFRQQSQATALAALSLVFAGEPVPLNHLQCQCSRSGLVCASENVKG